MLIDTRKMTRTLTAMAITAMLTMSVTATACHPKNNNGTQNTNNMETNTITLTTAGGTAFTATLTDNSSATALKELLAKGDITIKMEDYGDMEKVGPIGHSLPRNDTPTTTGPGDLILYQGKYLVIYYGTNSWTFTPLGHIDGVSRSQLLSALGKGDVTVTLSLKK